jgi:MFS family permease
MSVTCDPVHSLQRPVPAPRPAPVARLWLAVLCGYLALGATLQVLPRFVTRRFDAGSELVGAVIAVASLAAAALRPVAGWAADAGWARRSVLTAGALGVLAGLGHLWSPNLGVLLSARLLFGASEGALFVAAVAWVLRLVRPERRGGIAGWFGLSMWGGLALGPALAVGLGHLGGLNLVWVAVIALPAVGLALTLTTRPPDAPITPRPGTRRRLLPPSARLPGTAMGLASYGYGTIATLLLLLLDHGRIGGQGVALSLFALAFVVTRATGSPLVNRLGGTAVAVISSLVEAIGLILIASASTLPVAVVGIVICGVGVALLYPAMVAITIARTPSEHHGAAVGVMTSFWDLAIVVAGPIGGLVANFAGYPAAFCLAAGAAIAATLIIATALRVPRAPRSPKDLLERNEGATLNEPPTGAKGFEHSAYPAAVPCRTRWSGHHREPKLIGGDVRSEHRNAGGDFAFGDRRSSR